jgi:hypothetical protein
MRKLKNMPTRIATRMRLDKKDIRKFSLKKKTAVEFIKMENTFMMINLTACFRIFPFFPTKTQFRPRKKLVTAPQTEPRDVALT